MIYQHSPEDNIIRRFGTYAKSQLIKLKEELGLQIPLDGLRFCADYFRSAKRDPSVDELRFLNAISTLPPSPDRVLISELHTNDPAMAETYSDMMNKRGELSPNAAQPPSVAELFHLATAYMDRIGVSHGLENVEAEFYPTEAIGINTVGASNSKTVLSLTSAKRNAYHANVLMLIHRGNTPIEKYRDTFSVLLSNQTVRNSCNRIFTVPTEGLLPLLLPIYSGVTFDLGALELDDYPVTPMQLLGSYANCIVLELSQNHAVIVEQFAKECGLLPMRFATLNNSRRVELRCSDTISVDYETDFLRRLMSIQPFAAKLPDEDNAKETNVSMRPVGIYDCGYISNHASAQLASTEVATCSAAHTQLIKNPFRGALRTALASLLATTVGCGWKSNRFAFSLRYPISSNEADHISEAVSAILGIYRLQCELGIPAMISDVQKDNSISSLELDVYAVSPRQPISSQLTTEGSLLYCVEPSFTANGLPDFAALRKLLKELSHYHEQGLIQSARVFSNQSLADALAEMETKLLTYSLNDPQTLTEEALPLAILLEADAGLPYRAIGSVKPREDTVAPSAELTLPSLENVFNHGGCSEAVIFSERADVDAVILSSILRSMEIRCSLLDEFASEKSFAKALMNAQIAFICGEAKIPMNEQMQFARQVLKMAGGVVLQLGENPHLSTDFADYVLPDGISSEVLQQIAPKIEKNESFS